MLRTPKVKKNKISASHVRSPQQEKELAKRMGGSVVGGSGCGVEKADVRAPGLRIEAKTTINGKSYSLKKADLVKHFNYCHSKGEKPVFIVEFTENGVPLCEAAIVPVSVIEDMVVNYDEFN